MPPSINIVSYFGRQNGISQGAVLQSIALEALGYSVTLIDVTRALRNPFAKIECRTADLFVIHCAGSDFVRLIWPLRKAITQAWVVGYFACELASPPEWPKWDFLWDEIWTPSLHSANALALRYKAPVKVVPHVLLKQNAEPRYWAKGNSPLVFLAMADTRSSLSRKNPRGAVHAFQLAFPTETDVELIIKLQGPSIGSKVKAFMAEIEQDQRIRLVQKTLDRDSVVQLFREAHVFVSLHRAEGFGIPLLEAQTYGLATIATGWSGNLDFMTEQTSVLVPYKLRTMRDEGGVYGEVTWAEPDIVSAAIAMRDFYQSPLKLFQTATAGWQLNHTDRQMSRFAKALSIALSR